MARKCRVIDQSAVLFSSADLSAPLMELSPGTELELGETLNIGGKRSVVARMSGGQSGFVRHDVSVWQIREALLAQRAADLHEQPSRGSAVKKIYSKGDRFVTDDLVDGDDGKWMKIIGSEGETGYMHGGTKVLFRTAETPSRNAFLCQIPEKPSRRYEQLLAGMTPDGVFRDIYRSAEASFEGGELVVRKLKGNAAGDTDAIVARTAVKDIGEIIVSIVPVQARYRAAVMRSLVMSGGFSLMIFVGIALSSSGDERNLFPALGYSLLFGLGSGFLFSFLPGLFTAPKELTQLSMVEGDGSKIVIVVDELHGEEALNVIRTRGIGISCAELLGKGAIDLKG
jgi:hypothetical protein